jgi:hypothetical protein
MPLLFSYGTLQQRAVQLSTFGRALAGDADAILGCEASLVEVTDPHVIAVSGKTHHPNLTFNGRAGSRVPGMAFEVTDAELADADRYEAASSYARMRVTLASGKEEWVYVFSPTQASR